MAEKIQWIVQWHIPTPQAKNDVRHFKRPVCVPVDLLTSACYDRQQNASGQGIIPAHYHKPFD